MYLSVIVTLVIVFVSLICYIVNLFNSIVQVKNNIGKAWRNIEVLLLQRNGELAKLISLCREYIQYENDVFIAITGQRVSFTGTMHLQEKVRIENNLEERIAELNMFIENYPVLKANEFILNFQARISELETTIVERKYFFNETVNIYNIQIEKFPQIIFFALLKLEPQPYLKIPKLK